MFLTTHAAAGILLSRHLDQPWSVFGLAFLSHFILDFIPHGDSELYRDEDWRSNKKYRWVALVNAIDLICLLGLIFWSLVYVPDLNQRLLFLGILGAIIPDFLSHLFPVIHERFSWLWLIRWSYRLSKPTGLRYLVRIQDWIHRHIHHDFFERDLSFRAGLTMQIILTLAFLFWAS